MYNERAIRKILYRLKRTYSKRVYIQLQTTIGRNTRTGVITPTLETITVNRAIVLPVTRKLNFVYDLSFIAANKNFTYGGLFEQGDLTVILESRDLPVSFVLTHQHQFIIDGKYYAVSKGAIAQTDYSYVVSLKRVTGMQDDG